MFLSGVLFVLFLAGCWLYCLTDAALTPAAEFPGWRKPAWITVIAVTFIVGAIAWLIARRTWRARHWPLGRPRTRSITGFDDANVGWFSPWTHRESAAEALARHPASRSKNTAGARRVPWARTTIPSSSASSPSASGAEQ